MVEFDAELEAAERGPGCGIRLPFDPRTEFGTARAPVQVTVEGFEPFRTTTMVYSGVAWLGLRKDQQEAFGVGPGEHVRVTVERDAAPREVTLPVELVDALSGSPEATHAYQGLSYTHRREYARWIGGASKAETRQARAVKAVGMLTAGVRTPG